jgi:hypothetical protein
MQAAHLRQALIVTALALAGAPALAETTLPGTLCTSDGPVGRSVTGLMVNKVTSPPNDTTYFVCPILRSGLMAGTIRVYVNVKLNSSNDFECVLRSVSVNNVTHMQQAVVFPAASAANGGWDLRDAIVNLPAGYSSANMRCRVPNVGSNEVEAGIVSYRIIQN